MSARLTMLQVAGFAVIIGAFLALFELLGVEARSWESYALLAAALAAFVGYRVLLARRRIQ